MSSSSSKSSQARLREALTAGGPSTKDKGPPVADGVLSVTPDTAEAIEWRSRQSVVDSIAACSSFLDDDEDGAGDGSSGTGGSAAFSPPITCLARSACGVSIVEVQATFRSSCPANRHVRQPGILLPCDMRCCRPAGPQTSSLYGKFTWKLDRFGDSGKRELRSNVFEVGSFKWWVPAAACQGGAAQEQLCRPCGGAWAT